MDTVCGKSPVSRQLAAFEADHVKSGIVVDGYDAYPGIESDVLRPVGADEESFGGVAPADLNRARCSACPSLRLSNTGMMRTVAG